MLGIAGSDFLERLPNLPVHRQGQIRSHSTSNLCRETHFILGTRTKSIRTIHTEKCDIYPTVLVTSVLVASLISYQDLLVLHQSTTYLKICSFSPSQPTTTKFWKFPHSHTRVSLKRRAVLHLDLRSRVDISDTSCMCTHIVLDSPPRGVGCGTSM